MKSTKGANANPSWLMVSFLSIVLLLMHCNNRSQNQIKSDFSFDLTPVYTGDIIVFKNESRHAEEFIWSFGDGESSTKTNPTHIYLDEGVYTITLVAIDGNNSKVSTMEIRVLPAWLKHTIDQHMDGSTLMNVGVCCLIRH